MTTPNLNNQIVNQTLDVLRDQSNQAGDLDLRGKVTFNPTGLLTLEGYWLTRMLNTPRQLWDQVAAQTIGLQQKRSLILEPIKFDQSFAEEPHVTFGQMAAPLSSGPPEVGPTSSEPFVVEPYVAQLIWTNGLVDGMYLGVYALTNPPSGVTTHSVSWRAFGKSSRYNSQDSVDTWTDSYDYNDTSFLTEDTSDFENSDTGGVEPADESLDDPEVEDPSLDVPDENWPEDDEE